MEKIKKHIFGARKVWGFFVSVVVMAVLSLAFFYPDNFEGNVLNQPDMQQRGSQRSGRRRLRGRHG